MEYLAETRTLLPYQTHSSSAIAGIALHRNPGIDSMVSARQYDTQGAPTSDKEIMMTQHTINALLHLPADYELPEGCDINIKVQNVTDRDAPTLHSIQGSNKLSSARPINLAIVVDSDLVQIGSRFSVDVNIAHQGTALLLDITQVFTWAGGDHDTDIYLSPVGCIAAKISFMPRIAYPEDSKLYVKLIENTTTPEIIVSETVGLTAQTTPVYLNYDPSMIKPGQHYALLGSFETYSRQQLSLGLRPAKLILKPEKLQLTDFGN